MSSKRLTRKVGAGLAIIVAAASLTGGIAAARGSHRASHALTGVRTAQPVQPSQTFRSSSNGTGDPSGVRTTQPIYSR